MLAHAKDPRRAPSLDVAAARSWADRADAVAAVARLHAADVDARARFPEEAVAALKAEGLLGALVPESLGGGGARLSDMAEVSFRLGRACASSAMIFAMHQVKVACLVRHHAGSAWIAGFLRRLAERQLLVASSTTEGRGGGDVRSSSAPVLRDGPRIRLERDATVMSYGAEADAVVTTARRDADAASSDQVLVVFERADYVLTSTGVWDTLGMRGTRSLGYALRAHGHAAQVLSAPYADIHVQTMTPAAHLLWASVWAGIAAQATETARLHLRKGLKPDAPTSPAAAHHLRAVSQLRALKALIAEALERFEAASARGAGLDALDVRTDFTLLKVEASELAVATVMAAMRACGLAGYRNDGPSSLGRALRDILSAPLMIGNDRILADLGPAPVLIETGRGLLG